MTGARDVYDKVSTEKERLPQQKALTPEVVTIREWLVNSGSLIRWTADENMTMNALTKDHKESRQHLARVLQNGEWSAQRDASLVRTKPTTQSKRTSRTKLEQTSMRPCLEKLHDESNIVVNARKCFFFLERTISSLQISTVIGNVAYFLIRFFFFQFLARLFGNCFSRPAGGPILLFYSYCSQLPSLTPTTHFYIVSVSGEFVFLYVLHAYISSPCPFVRAQAFWFVRRYSVWIGGSILRCHLRPSAFTRSRAGAVAALRVRQNAFVAQQAEQDSRQILS